MTYVRYALLAFWLCASGVLGYKTVHNPIALNIVLVLFLVAGSQILGYFVRLNLETLLSYGGRLIGFFIFVGVVLAVRLPDSEIPKAPAIQQVEAAEATAPKTKKTESLVARKPAKSQQAAEATKKGDGVLDKACEKYAPNDAKCACVNNAIFKHDSSWATAGIGKKARNPCNMKVPRSWTPNSKIVKTYKGFAVFKSLDEGIDACVQLYSKFYVELTASTLVSRWTDGGGNQAYRSQVASCYN